MLRALVLVTTVPLRTMVWGRGWGWLKPVRMLESAKPMLESWPSLPEQVTWCPHVCNGRTLVSVSREWCETPVIALVSDLDIAWP